MSIFDLLGTGAKAAGVGLPFTVGGDLLGMLTQKLGIGSSLSGQVLGDADKRAQESMDAVRKAQTGMFLDTTANAAGTVGQPQVKAQFNLMDNMLSGNSAQATQLSNDLISQAHNVGNLANQNTLAAKTFLGNSAANERRNLIDKMNTGENNLGGIASILDQSSRNTGAAAQGLLTQGGQNLLSANEVASKDILGAGNILGNDSEARQKKLLTNYGAQYQNPGIGSLGDVYSRSYNTAVGAQQNENRQIFDTTKSLLSGTGGNLAFGKILSDWVAGDKTTPPDSPDSPDKNMLITDYAKKNNIDIYGNGYNPFDNTPISNLLGMSNTNRDWLRKFGKGATSGGTY
jgi:hypothetical protein